MKRQIFAKLWNIENLQNGLKLTDFKVCSIFDFWELKISFFKCLLHLFDVADVQRKFEEAKKKVYILTNFRVRAVPQRWLKYTTHVIKVGPNFKRIF